MLSAVCNWFVKITGWPWQKLLFRTRIRYEDKAGQGRGIHGPAVIVSNHTSVWDYGLLIFTFPWRTLRVQMADILFARPGLGLFLRMMGGIEVHREAHELNSLNRAAAILKKGGVVGIFPEGRLPRKGETPPLPFQEGAAALALAEGVPVIPVHIRGKYFHGRMQAVIGRAMDLRALCAGETDERKARKAAVDAMRQKIVELGGMQDGNA